MVRFSAVLNIISATLLLGYTLTMVFSMSEVRMHGLGVLSIALGASVAIVLGFIKLAQHPLVEKYLGWKSSSRPASNRELKRLSPLIEQLSIKTGVKINHVLVDETPEVTAYALGKGTVCVSRGCLESFSDEEVSGILAHEFGHLAAGDSLKIMQRMAARILPTFIVGVVSKTLGFLQGIFGFLSATAITGAILFAASLFLFPVVIILVPMCFIAFPTLWLDNRLGEYLYQKKSRDAEYAADRFAATHGYGRELLAGLESLYNENYSASAGGMSQYLDSHPPLANRLDALDDILEGGRPIASAAA